MAKNANIPPFYWHDNVYRAKIFSRLYTLYLSRPRPTVHEYRRNSLCFEIS